MQIKPPGFFTRGRIVLGRPALHITPETLILELSQAWGPQGYQAYKSALIGLDAVLRKSGWTGLALRIKQTSSGTEIAYNAFSPSAGVRMLMLGLIPIMILNAKAWKPLLRAFEQYAQSSPYFTSGQLGGGGQAQLPQAVASYPQGQPMRQQQQQQQQAPQYPCAQCGTTLMWVGEHQRWYCGRCQQYR